MMYMDTSPSSVSAVAQSLRGSQEADHRHRLNVLCVVVFVLR